MNMHNEYWKPVPGYGDNYEASNLGGIRSKDRWVVKDCPGLGLKNCRQFYKGRRLKPSKVDSLGHLSVHISVDRKKMMLAVHRAVLMAFIGIPEAGQEACHNNGIAGDNRIENLRWASHFENNQDRKKHGKYATGEAHHAAKISREAASEIATRKLHYEEYAEMYGISRSQAYRIWRGQSWSQS